MAKRTVVKYQGVKVALPRGARTLTENHKALIDAEYSQRRWDQAQGGACRGVFYNADTFALLCNKNRAKKSTRAGLCLQWSAGRTKCVKRAGARKTAKGRPVPGRRTTRGGEVVKAGGRSKAAKKRWSRREICRNKRTGKITTNCRKK